VGDKLSVFFLKNGVRNEQLVLNALTDANLGAGLVFESTEGETKAGEAFVGLSKKDTRLANLEVVRVLEFTFEDSGARLGLLRLALARAYVNVETNYVSGGENPLLNILSWSVF